MVRHNDLAITISKKLASHPSNRLGRLEQCTGCNASQTTNNLRLKNLQLSSSEIPAIGQLLRARVAIIWRSTFHRIQDVNVVTSKLHCTASKKFWCKQWKEANAHHRYRKVTVSRITRQLITFPESTPVLARGAILHGKVENLPSNRHNSENWTMPNLKVG